MTILTKQTKETIKSITHVIALHFIDYFEKNYRISFTLFDLITMCIHGIMNIV